MLELSSFPRKLPIYRSREGLPQSVSCSRHPIPYIYIHEFKQKASHNGTAADAVEDTQVRDWRLKTLYVARIRIDSKFLL